jgi:anti-sigma-K factor RskA
MTADHNPRHDELLPAYALGALEGDELRELERHLAAGCPDCERELALWQGDLEALAESVEPVQPSETTRRRILRLTGGTAGREAADPGPSARSDRPARSERPFTRWLGLAAAALLLFSVWSGVRAARLSGEIERLGAERDRLTREQATLGEQLSLARDQARRTSESLTLVTDPKVRTIQLAGLGPAPGASGRTFVDPRRGRADFYASALPALTPDKTYELWWFQGGKPVAAGTFEVGPDGRGSLRVENAPADTEAWAVTVEPHGGVPQPTGPIVLKG